MAAADYSRQHAEALRDVKKAGADVVFKGPPAGKRPYDPATGEFGDAPAAGDVEGVAAEVKGDPEQYAAAEVIGVDPLTLMFIPTTFGQLPAKGSVATWAGKARTVKALFPIRPAGKAIGARVVLA